MPVYVTAAVANRPRPIIGFLPRIETLRHARDNIYQAPDFLARGPGNEARPKA